MRLLACDACLKVFYFYMLPKPAAAVKNTGSMIKSQNGVKFMRIRGSAFVNILPSYKKNSRAPKPDYKVIRQFLLMHQQRTSECPFCWKLSSVDSKLKIPGFIASKFMNCKVCKYYTVP